MRICLITDTHFDGRNGADFLAFTQEKFFREQFFPFLDANPDITTLIHTGDLWDRRKFVSFLSLARAKKMFFDEIAKRKHLTVNLIVGNHDVAMKNTNEINSPELLLGEYENIHVYQTPEEIQLGNLKALLMPWICPSTYAESLEMIRKSRADVCFGHLELKGFEMYLGQRIETGLDAKLFEQFSGVYSGHFHHKSERGNINYLGAPYEMTWSDYGDARGFHVLDTQTLALEHIRNKDNLFMKVVYDDSKENYFEIKDMTPYENRIVRIIVAKRSNPVMFDFFMDKLYNSNLFDLSIIEDMSEFAESKVADMEDTTEKTTLDVMYDYIDQVDTEEKHRLEIKSIMRALYNEASSLDEIHSC